MIRERWLEHLAQQADDWHTPAIGVYHSSKLNPGGCLRRKVLVFRKHLERGYRPMHNKQTLVFDIGHMFHERIQGLFKPEQCEVEFKMPVLDFHIVGRADIVLPDRIVELKTWGAKKEEDGDWFFIPLPNTPQLAHLMQVEVLMRGFHKHEATICYIRKTDGETKEFNVRRDDQRWHEIVAYAAQMHLYLKTGLEPPIECNRCQYCKGGN